MCVEEDYRVSAMQPSAAGARQWSGSGWSVVIDDSVTIVSGDETIEVPLADVSELAVRRRLFGWKLSRLRAEFVRLRGVTTAEIASQALSSPGWLLRAGFY